MQKIISNKVKNLLDIDYKLIYDYNGEKYRIKAKNGDLVVSPEHKVYVNQIKPLRNNLTKSDVVNTQTSDCYLRCGSLYHIEALIDSAAARKSTSFGSGSSFVDSSRNSSYSTALMNLIDSSTSLCLISNSCSESFDLNKHSSLYLFNSDLINLGAENSDLVDANKYEVTDEGFIKEKNMLLSITNPILDQSNFIPFSEITFNNLSFVFGDTSESNLLNLPFLAFLPNSTLHLISSCSSLECSFFNNSLAFLSRSSNLSLISLDQFTQDNFFILDLSSGSAANVMDAIYILPLAFNSSNFSSSLILSTTTPRATAATFTSGNSFLNLFNSSSGTETVTLGILLTSNNYFNTSKYVNIYKSFGQEDLSDFKLIPITEVYNNADKKIYFLDSENKPIKNIRGESKMKTNGKQVNNKIKNKIYGVNKVLAIIGFLVIDGAMLTLAGSVVVKNGQLNVSN